MTENGLDIQTISTKRTDKQADRVLLLGQVTEKKEKANPSHFLKFLFARRTSGTFGFAPTRKADPSQNQKSHFFANAPIKTTKSLNHNLTLIRDNKFFIITIFSSKIFS
ncbi:MAG TPA: hypothetical protein PK904_08985 [Bacteroidales bacterium]|nr:hypothetical protein [Bacteroidales bacterium]